MRYMQPFRKGCSPFFFLISFLLNYDRLMCIYFVVGDVETVEYEPPDSDTEEPEEEEEDDDESDTGL